MTLKPVPQRVCAGHTDPERFYPFRCVLGLPGLCSGCQTWEAELQGPEGGGCVVGVASELVPRKGMLQQNTWRNDCKFSSVQLLSRV